VAKLWIPLSRGIWGAVESGETVDNTVEGLLHPVPDSYYTDVLSQRLEWDGRVLDCDVRLEPSEFEDVLETVLGRTLDTCARIVALFDCDMLVLGGRVTGHPWIRRRLVEMCPVAPDCVVALQDMAVSPELYPFADKHNRIADAKTCVVVGATLYHHASTVGGLFSVEKESGEEPKSLILGIVNPISGLMGKKPLFTGDEVGDSGRFAFAGELWLGEKRVLDPGAPANPLYRITWGREAQKRLENGWRLQGVVQATVSRPTMAQPSGLRVRQASGTLVRENQRTAIGPESLRLRLQTMFDDEYWLDTGVLSLPSMNGDSLGG
jgi:hypothetical protein